MKLLAVLLVIASQAWGLFDAAGRDSLGARSAGLAGSDVAAPSGAEGMLGNPAALGEGDGYEAALFGAGGAGGRLGQGALALTGALQDDLRLGLAFDWLSDQRLGGQSERTLALGAALELVPGWSLGLRAKGHRLESPGLGGTAWGGGLDLGLRLLLPSLGALPGRAWLGLSVDQVAGAWGDRAWQEAVPSTARLGAAYLMAPGWKATGEAHWVSSGAGDAVAPDYAAGLEWSRGGWALRAGWRAGAEQASLGLGAPIPWMPARLDYALQASALNSAVSQRLALSLALDGPPARRLRIRPEQWLRDPSTGEVLQARFKVSLDPRLGASSWWVELKDGEGRLLRTLVPASAEAGEVDWDGRDLLGNGVGGDVVYALVADTALGRLRREGLQALDREAFQVVDGVVRAAGLPEMALKPVLGSREGLALSHVVVELQDGDPAGAADWAVEFQDSARRRLRRLDGLGRVPSRLVWDGKDEQGAKVPEPLGLLVRLEVGRASGGRLSGTQPLFTQDSYQRARAEARAQPEMKLAGLGLPLLSGGEPLGLMEEFLPGLAASAGRRQQSFESGLRAQALAERRKKFQHQVGEQTWDMEVFEPGSAELKPEQVEMLDFVDVWVKEGKGKEVWIYGLASPGEPGGDALARERAMALAAYLRKHGDYGVQLVLERPQGLDKMRGVRLELH